MDNQQKLTVVSDAQVEAIGDKIGGNWLPFLMDMQLSRNYLNSMANPAGWNIAVSGLNDSFGWVQLERLPMEPQQGRNTLRAWQSVLSACHTLGLKTAFVLRRVNGRTKIYLGIGDGWDNKAAAVNLLKQCVSLHLPGAALTEQGANFSMPEELDGVGTCSGLITGIPSLQAEQGQPILQTLDTLSRGVLSGGGQKNYALVVVADPAQDAEISELQQKLLRIKSEIHTMASYSETQGKTDGTSEGSSHNKRTGLAMVMGLINAASVVSFYTGNVLGHLGMTALSTLMSSFIGDTGANNSKSQSLSQSLNREHRDFTVQYCEKLIDKHIARMEGGRSLGFWQVGVSVLGEERATVDAVLALLRSVYSGNDSYVEPIRVLNTTGNESMRQLICNQRFVPLPVQRSEGWHVLGRMYESLTTPMTTQELSIATSLPHMDVPGLRTVRNGVHFAMNPASVRRENAIVLGKLMDMGVQQTQDYQMDINALVRHTLVAGSTGSGKSTTCKRILCSVLDKGIPVMIIEPAKDDYVHWALELNRTLPPERQFTIYMPGAEAIEGVPLPPFRLNPFEPAAYRDSRVRLQQHSEYFATLLNACLPSEDIIPILIDESVQHCIRVKTQNASIDIDQWLNPQMERYPTMVSLACAGNAIIKQKTYAPQTKDSFEEILRTRFAYLRRGTRGSILNTDKSVNYDDLFARPVVINLSQLAGSKDKALIMSLLLLALYEYRQSRYANDAAYRQEAQKNRLLHLMLVEEAHNVLTKPRNHAGGGSPEMAAADLFTNILSEIRSYGQGMMIVDQAPTRLIDDALKNTNYKIIHRLTAPDDMEVMARSMALNAEQAAMISSLEIGQAIVCGDQDDGAAWVKMER